MLSLCYIPWVLMVGEDDWIVVAFGLTEMLRMLHKGASSFTVPTHPVLCGATIDTCALRSSADTVFFG
jgi:hypothetical protein